MKFIIILVTIFSLTYTYACDVCGCSLGGMSMGVLPQDSKHFIGLRYSYAHFNARINYNSIYFDDVHSKDTYNRYELYGRYYFTKRFSATAILPLVNNTMRGNTQNINITGLGDVNLIANYRLLKPNMDKMIRHQLTVGGGVTLPTGDSDRRDSTEIINRNFQAGIGALSYLANANYVARRKNMGLNIEASYRANTTNKAMYKFGNQFNTSANLFYVITRDKFAVLPMVGAYYERSAQHLSHQKIVFNTGGNALLGTLATQLYVGQCTFNIKYQLPIVQNYTTDKNTQIHGGARFQIGLRYSFK